MLKVTLGTGEVLEIPFSQTSALTITSVQTVDGLQVERAEAHTDIVNIEIVDDPAAAQPELVQMTGAEAAAINPDSGVEPGTEPPVVEPQTAPPIGGAPSTVASTPVDGATIGGGQSDHEGGDPGDVGPGGTPNPTVEHAGDDQLGATGVPEGDPPGEATQAQAEADAAAAPASESILQRVEGAFGIGHDDAVTAAQAAVTAGLAGDAQSEHVHQAIADVNAAIAAYPDSAELADAKFQLESLVGTAPAPGA